MALPEYKIITVTMVDGSQFQTRSTLGKDLRLDIDAKTHPAWIGRGNTVSERGSKVQKFRQKHTIDFMSIMDESSADSNK